MKRVMVIGQPGAGKSTLARALAARMGLPVVHLDHIHWMAGWVERPMVEKLPLIRAEEEKDRWIIEGGLSKSWPTRLARADTLVWVDVGLIRRLYRVLARSWRYHGQTRPDLPEGCPEQFHAETLEFLWFILRTARPGRRRMARTYAAFPGHKARLTTIAEVNAWLDSLPGCRKL
ncbi:MAG: AAA family ATPase [Pseudomonadota bacterium]